MLKGPAIIMYTQMETGYFLYVTWHFAQTADNLMLKYLVIGVISHVNVY